jgi:hypothetical protein
MKTEGKNWKWARWLLVAGVGLHFYFVQELVAAFAFFAIGFAVIAFVIASLCMLQRGWQAAVGRLVDGEHLAGQGFETGESGRSIS